MTVMALPKKTKIPPEKPRHTPYMSEPAKGEKQNSPQGSDSPKEGDASAFDLWLDQGLHQLFDSVANEPIPEELLNLIEADRNQ